MALVRRSSLLPTVAAVAGFQATHLPTQTRPPIPRPLWFCAERGAPRGAAGAQRRLVRTRAGGGAGEGWVCWWRRCVEGLGRGMRAGLVPKEVLSRLTFSHEAGSQNLKVRAYRAPGRPRPTHAASSNCVRLLPRCRCFTCPPTLLHILFRTGCGLYCVAAHVEICQAGGRRGEPGEPGDAGAEGGHGGAGVRLVA